jgi:hypothetical protein
LCRPGRDVEYAMETEAGRVSFDTQAARAVVAGLAAAPSRLSDMRDAGVSQADLLSNALALFAADQIRPVQPRSADVGALNRALLSRIDAPDALSLVALPVGAAMPLPDDVLRTLARGTAWPDELTAWREFMSRYGLA